MSRKMLLTLIFLMALVLSGLILVQTHLIKTASDIREEQFNKSVRNALARVALQLDYYEQKEARDIQREAQILAQLGQIRGINPPSENFSLFPRNGATQGSVSLQFNITEQSIFGRYR